MKITTKMLLIQIITSYDRHLPTIIVGQVCLWMEVSHGNTSDFIATDSRLHMMCISTEIIM